LPKTTQGNVQQIVGELSEWLVKCRDEIQSEDKYSQCAFNSASLAFVIQFDVVFGTPS